VPAGLWLAASHVNRRCSAWLAPITFAQHKSREKIVAGEDRVETVAIIGAGIGGIYLAAELGVAGYKLRLHDIADARLSDIRAFGGIDVEGERGGFAAVERATSDLRILCGRRHAGGRSPLPGDQWRAGGRCRRIGRVRPEFGGLVRSRLGRPRGEPRRHLPTAHLRQRRALPGDRNAELARSQIHHRRRPDRPRPDERAGGCSRCADPGDRCARRDRPQHDGKGFHRSAATYSPGFLPYDPCVSGRAWLALTLAVLGYPEQSLAHADEALVQANRLQHHNTMSLVLSLRCSVGQFLRDEHDVAKHAERLHALAVEHNFTYWAGLGMYFQGWARAKGGEMMAGIKDMQEALAICQTTGAQAYVPYNLAMLADMCRQANDAPQGRKWLDEAFDRFGRTDARYCEAELLRIDGELKLAVPHPDRDAAEISFMRAIEIARRQETKTAELFAAMSLARLWAAYGKRRQAYDLLTPIYDWFTEGFTTRYLVEAKQLIDGLGSSSIPSLLS
jgi:predicted ATPase